MHLGESIRKARKSKGYSLQDLSDRSGVSRSMLSQIERGEKNPTVNVACQIAEGLGTTLSRLLGEQEEREVIVTKRKHRPIYRDASTGFERHLLSPAFPSMGVEFVLNVIPPGKSSGVFPPHRKGVKEWITVAEGKLRIRLGEKTYDLEEGDSIYFEADAAHRFDNIGDSTCRYYLVIDSHEAI